VLVRYSFCGISAYQHVGSVFSFSFALRIIHEPWARWQFDIVEQEARLRANGFWERGAELRRISYQGALLHRKVTLELVRGYQEIGGYVVTGEADTPISTSGMWDDGDQPKFDPAAFHAFNGDLVVLVGWDKRRAWIAGGDRAAYWDTWSYPAGATVRPHLLASHYGRTSGQARVRWSVGWSDEATPFASGESATAFTVAAGSLREVTTAEFVAPAVVAPREAVLRASVRIGGDMAHNSWPLWVFPHDAWAMLSGVALSDPTGRFADLGRIAPGVQEDLEGARTVIATDWLPNVRQFVAGGGTAILLPSGPDPRCPITAAPLPFWREAVKIIERHPAWGDFPHAGWVGMQFLGCAPDHALDTYASGHAPAPILRRLDARTMRVHDYAVELSWGQGRVIISTLRFEGGQGDQPMGISRNVAAAYLLSCWVRYLRKPG